MATHRSEVPLRVFCRNTPDLISSIHVEAAEIIPHELSYELPRFSQSVDPTPLDGFDNFTALSNGITQTDILAYILSIPSY